MKFNNKPVNVRAAFAAMIGMFGLGVKPDEMHRDIHKPERRTHSGSHGVNMSPHQQRMCAKRKRRRKMARKSRRVNRRVA